VTHCEGGGRVTLAVAAAAARAGFDDVRIYYLSFADWARNETCPIVRDQVRAERAGSWLASKVQAGVAMMAWVPGKAGM
jgi:hypothetical protein